MKRRLVQLVGLLVVVFVAIQFFGPERTNPPVDAAARLDPDIVGPALTGCRAPGWLPTWQVPGRGQARLLR